MFGIVGIVVIFIMVFGGYVLAGGKMGIILKSLPFEMIMIGGAAVGAFFISNDFPRSNTRSRTLVKSSRGQSGNPEIIGIFCALVRVDPNCALQSGRFGRAY